jgi:hypothetical protein
LPLAAYFADHQRSHDLHLLTRRVGDRRDERFSSDLRIRLDHGEGVLRNVSASGIYFLTDLDLEVGRSLSFTLEFEAHQAGPVSARCTAKVVRVDPQGQSKGVAVSFESIEFHRIR